jgi:hypothetical protein
MKIEVGKYYKTRDGRKVGPMKYCEHDKWPWDVQGTSELWDKNGKSDEGLELDLIAEWQEPVPTLSGETIDQIAIDSLKFHFDQDLEPLQYEAFRVVLAYYGVSMP